MRGVCTPAEPGKPLSLDMQGPAEAELGGRAVLRYYYERESKTRGKALMRICCFMRSICWTSRREEGEARSTVRRALRQVPAGLASSLCTSWPGRRSVVRMLITAALSSGGGSA